MTDGLVLVHAFPVDASMWDPQIEAFGGRVPVLAPNLPGFGGSEHGGDVMTMDAAADRVAEAMDGANIDRAVVVGVSMGGYVAFAFWRRHRDKVAGFLFADTKAEADDEAGRERRRGVAEKARAEGSAPFAESPGPLLSEGAPTELWDRVKDMVRRQPGEAIAAAALGMGERPDSTPDLPTIDVPTLVVAGTADTLIPPDATRPIAAGIGAEFRDIEGAGHLSNLENPEAFNQVLEELLGRTALL